MTSNTAVDHESSRRLTSPALVIAASVVLAGGPVALAGSVPWVEGVAGSVLGFLRFCFAPLIRMDAWLHWFPIALVSAGLGWAVFKRVARMWAMRNALRRHAHRSLRPVEALYRVADRHAALTVTRVLSGTTAGLAFTAGLIRPRVYLAEILQTELTEAELEAVLLHELHHRRMRDPLRSLAITFIADVFFWVPLMRHGVDHVLARLEFAADDAARQGGDAPLASAILRVARLAQSGPSSGVGFTIPEFFERRIDRLLTSRRRAEVLPRARGRIVVRSALALVVFWILGVASSGSHAAHLGERGSVCSTDHASAAFSGYDPETTADLAAVRQPVSLCAKPQAVPALARGVES